MSKCPHIEECQQRVSKDSFEGLCIAQFRDIEWRQGDCFKHNDLGKEDKAIFGEKGDLRTPREWREGEL